MSDNSKTLLAQAFEVARKLATLTEEVLKSHIQRGDIVKATLLAIVSGRPVFFYGDPGIDKTGTIKAMIRAIKGIEFREDMMPMLASGADLIVESTTIKESTNEEGNKVISTPSVLGGAAKKQLFFGDEIWKTDDTVLKVLFDLFNLDDVRFEGQVVNNALWTFLAASNELPESESKVAALWSRMTIRVPVSSLDASGKRQLVRARQSRDKGNSQTSIPEITLEDMELMRAVRREVEIPDDIIDTVLDIYQELLGETGQDFNWLWNDDRRFGRVFDVLQAHALLAGRTKVSNQDFVALKWLLWDTLEQIGLIEAKLIPYTTTPLTMAQDELDALLSPDGAVEKLTKQGDRSQGIVAMEQCENAERQITQFLAQASDDAMRGEIEKVLAEVKKAQADVIAYATGTKKFQPTN